MNSYINYKKYFRVVLLGFLVLALDSVFSILVFAQMVPSSDIPPELVSLAAELGCKSQASCEKAFNNNLKLGVGLAQKYGVYDNNPETKKLANTFKTHVLSQLTSAENFEEEIIKIAENIIKNKSIARQLDLDQKNVTASKIIITSINNTGVDLSICRKTAESLTDQQLGACVRASKNLVRNKALIKGYIPEQRLNMAERSGAMIKLRDALTGGEYIELGVKNPDELGKICLRPNSPSQCDEIAKKFFGVEGVKYLGQARQQISSIERKNFNQGDNFTIVTPNGIIITGEDKIRDACDDAFDSHNLPLARSCGDLAVKNGFAEQEDIDKGLEFLESVGDIDFDTCREDPKSCEQFIPQSQRQQFKAGQQIEDILTLEIGLSPEQCSKGEVDHKIARQCFSGSKKALPKLEALADSSPEVRRIITQIKQKVAEGERYMNKSEEIQKTFKNEGGPGGCNSSEGCFAYCSNPANSPECIAFGAKHKVFTGEEAASHFQEYRGKIDNIASFSIENDFSDDLLTGNGNIPTRRIPSFGRPGPGFNLPLDAGGFQPNVRGHGGGEPSPECFMAIRSGDFVKAKEVCSVMPGGMNQPTSQPISKKNICPMMPTVNECPSGQDKIVTYSSLECGTYYSCQESKKTSTPPPPINRTSCPYGQYMDSTARVCVGNTISPVTTDCEKVNGIWNPETKSCKMPETQPSSTCPEGIYGNRTPCVSLEIQIQNCLSGQFWDGTKCMVTDYRIDPVLNCKQLGGTWNEVTKSCAMSGAINTCPSDQFWDGTSCVISTSTTSPTTSDPATMCAQYGGTWTDMTCTMPPR